jgi:cyanophycin synthetase
MRNFETSEFKVYSGCNHRLDRPAVCFTLHYRGGPKIEDRIAEGVCRQLPALKGKLPLDPGQAFAAALVQVMKMDMDLFINKYQAEKTESGYAVAVEYLDEASARDCIRMAGDWFHCLEDGHRFDFQEEFKKLQADFDRTLYGGPTLYSLIEAALKRNIPVHYLYEENQFQWGYGRKQVRGRSTTFHVDGIKDTEFTMYKDMVKDFLVMCGFPTPVGKTFYAEEGMVEAAEALGYPVVVKPVAGHKGQGVTTGIMSADQVRQAFWGIKEAAKEQGVPFDGAIVEKQIFGTDHRLLSVKGKFTAALERVPAYVDGDGSKTIAQLIEVENATPARIDNARSPLCKIKADDNLVEFLKLQNLTLSSVPPQGQRVFLRRVANISAGGVSINVTDKIHPKNVRLVEDIAKFFNVTCLGIDVLCRDISRPWDQGDFGIIEINAGPGIFMHLAPAIGRSIDVPGAIIRAHFPNPGSERIPIITGNRISFRLAEMIRAAVQQLKPDLEFGSLTSEGLHFGGQPLKSGGQHHQDVKVLLRNPRLDLAVINHASAEILEYGLGHWGADLVILESPDPVEKILARDLTTGGWLVEVDDKAVKVTRDGRKAGEVKLGPDRQESVFRAVEPLLAEMVNRYN